jgi:hypothetical protein
MPREIVLLEHQSQYFFQCRRIRTTGQAGHPPIKLKFVKFPVFVEIGRGFQSAELERSQSNRKSLRNGVYKPSRLFLMPNSVKLLRRKISSLPSQSAHHAILKTRIRKSTQQFDLATRVHQHVVGPDVEVLCGRRLLEIDGGLEQGESHVPYFRLGESPGV